MCTKGQEQVYLLLLLYHTIHILHLHQQVQSDL